MEQILDLLGSFLLTMDVILLGISVGDGKWVESDAQ